MGKTSELCPCLSVKKMREGMEEREAATATERNAVKRSEEAGAIAEHGT